MKTKQTIGKNLVRGISVIMAVLLVSCCFTSCSNKGGTKVPNVMGLEHSDAKKILEGKGFEVTELEVDADSILPNGPISDNRDVKKGEVFKVNDETSSTYNDYDGKRITEDGTVTIYYAKTNYKCSKEDEDSDEYEETTKATKKKAKQTTTKAKSASKVSWKEFIDEYEDWVDSYVELAKKYKDNPSDLSILSDYTDAATEIVDWSEKAQDVQDELSGEDLTEYINALTRISKKISDIQ